MAEEKYANDFLKSVLPQLDSFKSMYQRHAVGDKKKALAHIIIEAVGFDKGKYETKVQFATIRQALDAGAPEKIATRYRSCFIIYKGTLLKMLPLQKIGTIPFKSVEQNSKAMQNLQAVDSVVEIS